MILQERFLFKIIAPRLQQLAYRKRTHNTHSSPGSEDMKTSPKFKSVNELNRYSFFTKTTCKFLRFIKPVVFSDICKQFHLNLTTCILFTGTCSLYPVYKIIYTISLPVKCYRKLWINKTDFFYNPLFFIIFVNVKWPSDVSWSFGKY